MNQARRLFVSAFPTHSYFYPYRIPKHLVSQTSRRCFSVRCSYPLKKIQWKRRMVLSDCYTSQQRYQSWPTFVRYFSGIERENGHMTLEQSFDSSDEETLTKYNVTSQQPKSVTYDFTKLDKVLTFHVNNLQENGFSEERIVSAVTDTMDAFFNDTLKHLPGLLERDELKTLTIIGISWHRDKALAKAPAGIQEKLEILDDEIHKNVRQLSCQAAVKLMPFSVFSWKNYSRCVLVLKRDELDPLSLYKATQYSFGKLQKAKFFVGRLSKIIKDREVHAKSKPEDIQYIVKTLILMQKSDLLSESMLTCSTEFIREVILDGNALSSGTLVLDIMVYVGILPCKFRGMCEDIYTKVNSRFIEIVSEISLSNEIMSLSVMSFGFRSFLLVQSLGMIQRTLDDIYSLDEANTSDMISKFMADGESSSIGKIEDKINSQRNVVREYLDQYFRRVALSSSSNLFERANALHMIGLLRIPLTEEELSSLEIYLFENRENLDVWTIYSISSVSVRNFTWPSNVGLVHAIYDCCFETIATSSSSDLKHLHILFMCGRLMFNRMKHSEDSEYRKKYVEICKDYLWSDTLWFYSTHNSHYCVAVMLIALNIASPKGIPMETFRNWMSRSRAFRLVSGSSFLSKLMMPNQLQMENKAVRKVSLFRQAHPQIMKEEFYIPGYSIWHSDTIAEPRHVKHGSTDYLELVNSFMEMSNSQQINSLTSSSRWLTLVPFVHKELDDTLCSLLCKNGDTLNINCTKIILSRLTRTGFEPQNKDLLKEMLIQMLERKELMFHEKVGILSFLSKMNICPDDLLLEIFSLQNIQTAEQKSKPWIWMDFCWLNLSAVLDAPHLGLPWLQIKISPRHWDVNLTDLNRYLRITTGQTFRNRLDYEVHTEAAFMFSKSRGFYRLNDQYFNKCTDSKKYAMVGSGSFSDVSRLIFDSSWYAKANERFVEKLGFNIIKIDSTDWGFLPHNHKISYLSRILEKLEKEE